MKAGTDTFLSLSPEFNWTIEGGKLVGTMTERIYEATDCSGTALATLTAPVQATAHGTTTANGKTGTRVELTRGALLAGLGGTTVTINQVTYINDTGIWTEPLTGKDLMYAEGNRLFTGDDSADPEGFPKALDLTPASAWVKLN